MYYNMMLESENEEMLRKLGNLIKKNSDNKIRVSGVMLVDESWFQED